MTKKTQFINHQWLTGSGNLIISRNPMTEEVLWQGYSAGEAEVSAAVKAAKLAWPTWSRLTVEQRIPYLKKFADLLEQSQDEIILLISKETGKPLWESKTELQAMINKVNISIAAYQERCPEIKTAHPQGGFSIRRHKPHGVIAVFGPFNFPGHLPNGHIIPALLAGNTVVFKPSELAPAVAERIIQVWEQAGLPPGVLNLVQGARDTGRLLTGQKDLAGIYFTGSWQTGLFLSELYAKTPYKILALEMGGNNPLVVSQIKNLKAAAYTTILSAYLTSGQRCSCARRLIVPSGPDGDQFIEMLIKMINSLKVGSYDSIPEPFMGPVINESTARHLLAVQQTLKSKGGNPLIDMRLLKVDSALLSPGLIDVTSIKDRPDEEIFGPLLQLIRVEDFNAAIEEANNTSYGLTAGLLSDNEEEYKTFYNNIRAGVINWNAPLTGASSSAPFGGVGHSGNLRPSGYYAADYCSYPVASIESEQLELPEKILPGMEL